MDFARRPPVGRLLLVAFLARMPVGMVGFAMLMFLREALGDFALAGTAVGINFVAIAAAAPVQGRLIDRYGPGRLLYVTGVVQPLALIGVLAAARLGWGLAAVAAFAAIAGVFASPITTLTRTLWRHLFDGEEDRRTAFAMDAVMIEINFTLGPAIVGAILALSTPTAAFVLGIAMVVASALIYVGSGMPGHFKRAPAAERHLLGPLTEPRLWVVFIAMFGITTGFGILEVGYPAFSTFLGMGAFAGALLAINSLGSAVGGALYGALRFGPPLERQFAACMVLMALPFGLHAAFLHPAAFAVLAFASGALIAPTLTAHAVLVSRLAPHQYATEAFTWSSTFIVSGIGFGMALGGVLAEGAGLRTMFVASAGLILAAGLLAWFALPPRGREREQPSPDRPS